MTWKVKDIVNAVSVVRKLLNMRQEDVAQKINITRSAVNQFERRKTTLSEKTIFALLKTLHINKDWALGNSDTLLESKEILYMSCKRHELLQNFIMQLKSADYLCIPHFSKKENRQLFELIVKLPNNTVCVVNVDRISRTNKDFCGLFKDMFEKINKNVQSSCVIMNDFDYNEEIISRIRDKTITINDIEKLYEKLIVMNMDFSLTVSEKEMIIYLRKHNVSLEKFYQCFTKFEK